MRQRNVSGSPLIIPDIPAEVPPGGEIDFPQPLAGFEVVQSAPKPKQATAKKSDSDGSSQEASK